MHKLLSILNVALQSTVSVIAKAVQMITVGVYLHYTANKQMLVQLSTVVPELVSKDTSSLAAPRAQKRRRFLKATLLGARARKSGGGGGGNRFSPSPTGSRGARIPAFFSSSAVSY